MNMKRHFRPAIPGLVIAAIPLLLLNLPCPADVLVKTDGTRMQGQVVWMPASKVYSVKVSIGGAIAESKVPPSEVASLEIPKPPNLDSALATKNITTLEQIMREYDMRTWDAVAGRGLLNIYSQSGQAAKAVELGQKLIRQTPALETSENFAPAYWDAMIKAGGHEDALIRAFNKAVEQGSTELAAWALIKRGDLLKKKGTPKEALVDGYLRTIHLFDQVKEAQPEALYGAIKCFEELGQQTNADRYRKKLLGEYADSPYAKAARGSEK